MSELEKLCYELSLEIENMPASEQQTKVSILASELGKAIKAAEECDECGLPKFDVCINDACANQYK